MFGKGLVNGLAVTIKHHLGRKITRQYPEERPELPARSRGSLGYDIERCIACNICVQVCPNRVVKVEAGRGPDGKKRARQMTIELQYCLFCGLCVENCPTSCIYFTPDFELACFKREDSRRVYRQDLPPEIPGKQAAKAAAPAEASTGGDTGGEKAELLVKKQETMKKLAAQLAALKKEAADPALPEEERNARLQKVEKLAQAVAKAAAEIKELKGGGNSD